ncbi:protein FAM83G isoform X1 [Denticeps clupeoides]|uniref:Scaffolding anchor of CK1 domain-containing protein n=1 Tax=Denticeps clupeoides TaxID=299321 RepID=A0AAY4CH01_9TELE|nr:protein FAM83G-like isoform X1 [Denticeps clupeoides]XP_028830607.1 protein FAM83G-like isoform X1 [Denticeps clupeoides]XP_028830608.1 protein FAM83G-like isoform X1 [Denticeps clupeoides]
MALSQVQCLDDNHVNWRVSETKPEFFYSEEQRLALETLITGGREAFHSYLTEHKLRHFLSDAELEELSHSVEQYRPGSEHRVEPVMEANKEDGQVSLQYWPDRSDVSCPDLDLGWPDTASYRGVTRVNVYTQPPASGQMHIKEVVRKTIAQAQKVIAIVMDMFTDVDIFKDLLDAGFKRKVAVYIIMEMSTVPHFISMCERAAMHREHLKYLRVRCIGGAEFYTRSAQKVQGTLGQRFMFVDGDRAVSGSYSFTWKASRLDRNLITVMTGQAVETFDRQFRELYLTSRGVNLSKMTLADPPEPDPTPIPAPTPVPSVAVARKLINPKYSLVTADTASRTSSDKASAKNSTNHIPVPEMQVVKQQKEPAETTHMHPGLLGLPKAELISYLPIWPEPDPPSDVIGFINIRDVSRPAPAHLMRSELAETSQAIRFTQLLPEAQQDTKRTHTDQQDTQRMHTGQQETLHTHTGQQNTQHMHTGQQDTQHTHTDQQETLHTHTGQQNTQHTHTGQQETQHTHADQQNTQHMHTGQQNTQHTHMGQQDTLHTHTSQQGNNHMYTSQQDSQHEHANQRLFQPTCTAKQIIQQTYADTQHTNTDQETPEHIHPDKNPSQHTNTEAQSESPAPPKPKPRTLRLHFTQSQGDVDVCVIPVQDIQTLPAFIPPSQPSTDQSKPLSIPSDNHGNNTGGTSALNDGDSVGSTQSDEYYECRETLLFNVQDTGSGHYGDRRLHSDGLNLMARFSQSLLDLRQQNTEPVERQNPRKREQLYLSASRSPVREAHGRMGGAKVAIANPVTFHGAKSRGGAYWQDRLFTPKRPQSGRESPPTMQTRAGRSPIRHSPGPAIMQYRTHMHVSHTHSPSRTQLHTHSPSPAHTHLHAHSHSESSTPFGIPFSKLSQIRNLRAKVMGSAGGAAGGQAPGGRI